MEKKFSGYLETRFIFQECQNRIFHWRLPLEEKNISFRSFWDCLNKTYLKNHSFGILEIWIGSPNILKKSFPFLEYFKPANIVFIGQTNIRLIPQKFTIVRQIFNIYHLESYASCICTHQHQHQQKWSKRYVFFF